MEQSAGGTRNEVAGSAGNVVQVGVVRGDVHLHGGRGVSPLTPHQLPGTIPSFVGREAELAKLDGLAARRAGSAPIGIVAGSPGVGKTALAVHWAWRERARFPDGDLYFDLHGYSPGPALTADDALSAFLLALDVPGEKVPRGVEAKAALFRSLLVGRRMLILLDNVTRPDDVRAVLPSTPECLLLVTSRSSLPGLVARNSAYRITLDMLPPADSAALLREVIGTDRTDEDPGAIGELADRCGHLPLALRIAGERVAAHPHRRLGDLLGQLASETDRLDVLETDGDEMSAIRAVFSWSYRALAPETARVFRMLALHPGPTFSAAATAVVTGEPIGSVRRWLGALTDGYLLMEIGHERYRFHDLLRVYAKERMDEEETQEQREKAVRSLLGWYLACADSADRVLTPRRRRVPYRSPVNTESVVAFRAHGDALEWCETERTNLVSAVHAAVDADLPEIACRLPLALWAFFTLRKPWADWVAMYQAGLAAARRCGDRFSEASLLAGLGIAHRDLRRFEEAMTYLRTALAIRREIGDDWGEAQALVSLGTAHHEQSLFTEALRCLTDGLAVFRRLGDEWGEAQTLHCLGRTCHELGRSQEAHDHLRQALTIRHAIGYRYGEAETLAVLGLVCEQLTGTGEAVRFLTESLGIRREIGDRYGEAATLDDLGEVWRAAGETGTARTCWTGALTIFTDLGAPRAAEVYARLRDLD
ncbi:Tetratricopeptide repeat-containing protein [Lentzea fradiae]|uniref:Tetratricopeptide repeat-containing protein n=1 Tax=Lentzea fradiae TaxID=200378 RepID=A0A1G7SB70_9PSEU|nr:tetratricopeptide repeat protein [Lentzea fradiae]SDG19699.1 Tetratricopeptide repeat-containing protein [Lentzea fradiae]